MKSQLLLRLMAAITLLVFMNAIVGCSKTVRVSPEDKTLPHGTIVGVVLEDGEKVDFGVFGGQFDELNQTIVGHDPSGEKRIIELDDVLYILVKRSDPVATVVTTLGVLALAALTTIVIVLLTKESCPFIYSWDGAQFVQDAEPLGGAISDGMRRTDNSRLEHLRAVDGLYRLLVRNEVAETQYLDHFQLRIVDHRPEYQVVSDTTGGLYLVGETVAPIFASDETGRDLLPFMIKRDSIAWRSKLPVRAPATLPTERHHLTFKFLRPPGATKAQLLYNIGTPLWGSNMLREMLQLRGDGVDAWYEKLKERGAEYDHLYEFLNREELWRLKILIEENDSLALHGFIPGAGPLIVEDRMLQLDLSQVKGDTVTMHFNPPYGFWKIDHLALQFETLATPTDTRVILKSATDHKEQDITDRLRENDSEYHVMPEVGDWCELVFDAPPESVNTKRTIFLETSGYYLIHFDEVGPPRLQALKDFEETPGAAVRYSFKKYMEFMRNWQSRN